MQLACGFVTVVDCHRCRLYAHRYTGADISAVCREAAMAALEQDLDAAGVAARHFDVALSRVKPSSAVGSALMARYQQFQRHSGAQEAWKPEGDVTFCV